MRALILVDLQNDFMPKGALPIKDGDKIISASNRLIVEGKFQIIVGTQDQHFLGHCSFASSHADKKVGDIVEVNGIKQMLWPLHCLAGEPGAAFHKDLLIGKVNLILRKGFKQNTDSYSGFRDNAKQTTGLAEYLKALGITNTYIVGLALDYCVKYTALDSSDFGFKTHLVLDGCKAVNLSPDDGDKAVEEMKKTGIIIEKEADKLIKSWQ